MRLEEAPTGKAGLQFLQRQVSGSLLVGGTQVGFTVAAGGIEHFAGIKKHNAIFFFLFSLSHFIRQEYCNIELKTVKPGSLVITLRARRRESGSQSQMAPQILRCAQDDSLLTCHPERSEGSLEHLRITGCSIARARESRRCCAARWKPDNSARRPGRLFQTLFR